MQRPCLNLIQIACMTTILSSTTPHAWAAQTGHFDTDSKQHMVDCGATVSITYDLRDCKTTQVSIQWKIKEVAGFFDTQIYKVWQIKDDTKDMHIIHIPNGLYIPQAPIRLLSPQHWA